MINVRAQELEAIIESIDRALNLHDVWRDHLHRTIICKLQPTAEDLDENAHKLCAFGKWFYSPGNAHLRELGNFQRLGNIHEAMHAEARNLLSICHGRWVITAKDYDNFLDAMYQFRSQLLIIRHKASETLHKIDALTGVFAPSQLLPDLEEIAARQCERAYALIRLKFDLVSINDRFGHAAGDRVLRTCLAKFKGLLGEQDRIYRYTGADFIFCLADKSLAQAEAIREKLLLSLGPAYQQALQISWSLQNETAEAIDAGTACASPADEPAQDQPSLDRAAHDRPAKPTGRQRPSLAEKEEDQNEMAFTVQHATLALDLGSPPEKQINQAGLKEFSIKL